MWQVNDVKKVQSAVRSVLGLRNPIARVCGKTKIKCFCAVTELCKIEITHKTETLKFKKSLTIKIN